MTELDHLGELADSAGLSEESVAMVGDLLARCTFPDPPGADLTCAVSGGADSLSLLVLARAHGCRVTAVHVDHSLRPGSEHEADVVEAAAARFGAEFRAERVGVPAGPNLEARARAARFAVLPGGVATGHTMDDQAETVLVNLLRGSGLDGGGAMEPGVRHPLLGLRRSETVALCRSVGLEPVSDPSNNDPRYLRNRIRHEVLPLLAEVSRRDPVPVLARGAALSRDEAALLDALAAETVPDPTDARSLAAAPVPLARRAVRRWLRDEGATVAAEGRSGGGRREGESGEGERGVRSGLGYHPPSAADVARVLAVARGEAVGTEIVGGASVRRSGGRLTVRTGDASRVPPVTTREVVADAAAPVDRSAPAWAGPQVGPAVVDEHALAQRVAELGAQISADYADDPPLLVAVLKGAMLFLSDLCRSIELPVDVDFMAVASYGSSTRSSGVVRIVKDLDAELSGRSVLVVEDIIDSGLTLSYLRKYLQARQPASVEVCALLVKEGVQRVDQPLRYVGFTIPSSFVVGYGLDVDERFRNLRGVYSYLGKPSGSGAAGGSGHAGSGTGGAPGTGGGSGAGGGPA